MVLVLILLKRQAYLNNEQNKSSNPLEKENHTDGLSQTEKNRGKDEHISPHKCLGKNIILPLGTIVVFLAVFHLIKFDCKETFDIIFSIEKGNLINEYSDNIRAIEEFMDTMKEGIQQALREKRDRLKSDIEENESKLRVYQDAIKKGTRRINFMNYTYGVIHDSIATKELDDFFQLYADVEKDT
ncbi:MAG: hypothetical protein AAF335_02775 [Bacteroidota bacterium]